jgi:Rrf2 family protein
VLSKTSKYAFQALILIASVGENEYILSKQIASALSIPKEYLNKVMQLLVRMKYVKSLKGPQGGFRLARHPREITIYDVLQSIEGTDFFQTCLLRAGICDERNPCALHFYWQKTLGQIRGVLDRVTLDELVKEVKEGKRVLQFADNVFLIQDFKKQIGIK